MWMHQMKIHLTFQYMMQPGYRLTVHVQTYLKNKIGRSSNISKITKQSYFVICLNYHDNLTADISHFKMWFYNNLL
jgi:hypothetical protein